MCRYNRLISASEIGTWCYCTRAWHLQRLGYPSSLTKERTAGSRYHQAHFQSLCAARRQRAGALVVIVICLVVLIRIAIAGLWSQG